MRSRSDSAMAALASRMARSMIHGPALSVPGPLVTIISLGYAFTDAERSSAKSVGIGIGPSLPSVFSGLSGHCCTVIREGDRNIFIGECKVWSGPKTMEGALDQLFRYLVWRDTKAAILLFIRNKDVSAVIEKAIAKIEEHPNHKRSTPRQDGDEEIEFTMHQQDDVNREIRLALLPFALRPVGN